MTAKRDFVMRVGRQYERYQFLFKNISEANFLKEYLKLKNQSGPCSDLHLDYLIKKEVVLKINNNKCTLHNYNLNPTSRYHNGDQIYDKKFEVTITSSDVFQNNPPIKQFKKLCNTLNWTNDSLYMEVEGSLIVGLGDSNVSETSMTIHHTYGIPYIPGQAIKGMFRNYFINELIQDINQPKQIKVNGKNEVNSQELYEFIFGDILDKDDLQIERCRGNVVFFDAFPVEKCTIAMDIMTPHFPNYYAGKEFPVDSEKIIPIPFYVVRDSTFAFHYGIRGGFTEKGTDSDSLTSEELNVFIRQHLIKALENHGIGAKTAVGYGYMKNDQNMYTE